MEDLMEQLNVAMRRNVADESSLQIKTTLLAKTKEQLDKAMM
jgi:hypothetical protein